MREGRPCQSPTTNKNRLVHVMSMPMLGVYSTHPKLQDGMAFLEGLASMTSLPEPSGGDCRHPAHTNTGFKGVCSLSSHQAQTLNPVRTTLTLARSQTGCREAEDHLYSVRLVPTAGSSRGSIGTTWDSPCHLELDMGLGRPGEPVGAHPEDAGLPGKGGSCGSASGSAYGAGRRYMVSSLSAGLLFPPETSPKGRFCRGAAAQHGNARQGRRETSSAGCDIQAFFFFVFLFSQIRVIDKRHSASVVNILTSMRGRKGLDKPFLSFIT